MVMRKPRVPKTKLRKYPGLQRLYSDSRSIDDLLLEHLEHLHRTHMLNVQQVNVLLKHKEIVSSLVLIYIKI